MSEPKPERESLYLALLLKFGEFTYHVDWWEWRNEVWDLLDVVEPSSREEIDRAYYHERRNQQVTDLLNEYEQWCADLPTD